MEQIFVTLLLFTSIVNGASTPAQVTVDNENINIVLSERVSIDSDFKMVLSTQPDKNTVSNEDFYFFDKNENLVDFSFKVGSTTIEGETVYYLLVDPTNPLKYNTTYTIKVSNDIGRAAIAKNMFGAQTAHATETANMFVVTFTTQPEVIAEQTGSGVFYHLGRELNQNEIDEVIYQLKNPPKYTIQYKKFYKPLTYFPKYVKTS